MLRRSFIDPGGPPATLDEARAGLVPVVRSRSWYSASRIKLALADLDPETVHPWSVLSTIGDDLVVSLDHDSPDLLTPVPQDQLRGWGLGADQAYGLARANLAARSREPLQQLAPGLYASGWRDNLDASRLVVVDELTRSLRLRGDLVAAVPDRDTLLVTGADDQDGLAALARQLEKVCDESGVGVSVLPVRLVGGQWTSFVPPADHPLFATFQRLRLRGRSADYNGQKELLQALMSKRGEGVFVASLMVTRPADSPLARSTCTWGKGVATLLPRADRIGLVDPGAPEAEQVPAVVAWERAEAVLGPFVEWTGLRELHPPRYRVDGFPTPGQLGALAEPGP